MRLVLDGMEDRAYKPAHIVGLYGGVPMQVSYNGYYPSPPSW